MTYGALGVVFGSVLGREVEGMFAILMISILDVALQNPLSSSGSDSSVVRLLPSYGAVQASMAAAFSSSTVTRGLVIQLLWLVAAAFAALLVFRRRTRYALPSSRPRGPSRRVHGPPCPRRPPYSRRPGTPLTTPLQPPPRRSTDRQDPSPHRSAHRSHCCRPVRLCPDRPLVRPRRTGPCGSPPPACTESLLQTLDKFPVEYCTVPEKAKNALLDEVSALSAADQEVFTQTACAAWNKWATNNGAAVAKDLDAGYQKTTGPA